MTPDTWEPFSRPARQCPDCGTWSPELPGPDAFLDEAERHETECVRSAAA
jgi:hypothetical protein